MKFTLQVVLDLTSCSDAFTRTNPLGIEMAAWNVPLALPVSGVVVLDALGMLASRISEVGGSHLWVPSYTTSCVHG